MTPWRPKKKCAEAGFRDSKIVAVVGGASLANPHYKCLRTRCHARYDEHFRFRAAGESRVRKLVQTERQSRVQPWRRAPTLLLAGRSGADFRESGSRRP